jgi:signal transduction histidine kinase
LSSTPVGRPEKSPDDIAQDLAQVLSQLQKFGAAFTELRRSNVELDRFASVAAHDLRSPLMSLTLCLTAIVREELTPDTSALLAQAHESIVRMGSLITDLLTYAQVGHGDLRKNPCDVNAALFQAIASVRAMADSVGAQITHDELPVVRADETLIIQVFQNLLENGLKYSQTPPRIHISSQDGEHEHIFSVTDQGIGIPAIDLEEIFKPFIRLHAGEYPGTGLGLATCRRAIARHKGRLWVESKQGSGSTFFFALPK